MSLWTVALVCLVGSAPAAAATACADWDEARPRLSESDRRDLERFGVAAGAQILGPPLVEDCEERLMIARFLSARIGGRPLTDAEYSWALAHRDVLGATVEKAWPYLSRHDSHLADGAFTTEAYGILAAPLIGEERLTRIVREEIRRQGVGGSLAYLIWNRPLDADEIRSVLRARLRSASPLDAEEVLWVYALLDRYGEEVTEDLARLESYESLSQERRRLLRTLTRKRQGGARWEFDDVAEFGYLP